MYLRSTFKIVSLKFYSFYFPWKIQKWQFVKLPRSKYTIDICWNIWNTTVTWTAVFTMAMSSAGLPTKNLKFAFFLLVFGTVWCFGNWIKLRLFHGFHNRINSRFLVSNISEKTTNHHTHTYILNCKTFQREKKKV